MCARKDAEIVKLRKQIASVLEESEVAVRAAQRQVQVTKDGLSSLQMRIHSELGIGNAVSLGSSGTGAQVVTERVVEMIRSCMATWQQEKMNLSQQLADATQSLESLEAERSAADQAATRHHDIFVEELQSQKDAAAAAGKKLLAELEAQSVQVQAMRRERESWQAVREKVRRKNCRLWCQAVPAPTGVNCYAETCVFAQRGLYANVVVAQCDSVGGVVY
jgi:DNA repair exonuclease SbcCD ATPase subunit